MTKKQIELLQIIAALRDAVEFLDNDTAICPGSLVGTALYEALELALLLSR